MTAARPARAVVVGAGLMGRWHAHAIGRVGGRVVAVVDSDRDAAERLARRVGAAVTPELARALEEFEPDVVHVCSPLATHHAVIGTCLAASTSVLAEKPVTDDAASTEHLLRMAREHRVLLVPVHQFLFQRGFIRTQRELAEIGIPHALDYVACSAGGRGRSSKELDQIVADILPHPLAMVRRLFPAALGESWHVQRAGPGEWRVAASGAPFSMSFLISLAGRPTRNTLRLIGSNGTLHLDLFHGFRVRESGLVSRSRKAARPFRVGGATLAAAGGNLARRLAGREPAYPGLRELVRLTHRAAIGGDAPPITPEETLDVARARDAIRSCVTAPD